jgi:hypothetical protein
MAKKTLTSLTDPGEYDVVLKDVRVERFNPGRGVVGQRVCWTLAVDGGEHDKQPIYLTMPLLEVLPWAACKALRAFGLEVNGKWSLESDAAGRVLDPRLRPGARAHATIVKDRTGKASVRLAPTVSAANGSA